MIDKIFLLNQFSQIIALYPNDENKKKDKRNIKFLSLFSGIGAFEKALDRLEIDYELVGYSEIDKYASKSYSAIHGVPETLNLGDITKINEKLLPKDIDLITYGFPCQDISIAGKQEGLFDKDGTRTRSGLFFDALRIIEETKPKVAIAENVKNLTSKKFAAQFKIVLESLEQAGYNNYWKVLNAKDYGIPQNRERVFIVSIRKDVDTGFFQFPQGFPLKLRMRDLLENEVDEKYYISQKMKEYVLATGTKNYKAKPEIDRDVACTLTASMHKMHRANVDNYVSETFVKNDVKMIQVGQLYGTEKEPNLQAGRIYNPNGISPTVDTCSGGNRMPKIIEEPKIQKEDIVFPVKVRKYKVDCELLATCLREHKGNFKNKEIAERLNVPLTTVEHWFRKDDSFAIPAPEVWPHLKELLGIETDEFDKSIMTFEIKEGVYEKSNRCYHEDGISPTLTRTDADIKVIVGSTQKNATVNYNGICPTLTSAMGMGGGHVPMHNYDARIRKLTPKECWRLMDFADEDFEKAEAVNSNTQLYKQAGNSIVINVLYHIFECLFNANVFKESNIGEYIMKCDKEIHFYVYECTHEQCVHSWKETEQSIVDFVPEIHTTQIGLMQTGLIVYCGYRIFIHDNPKNEKEYYEIKIDNCNKRSNREIKEKHDIFKMWIAGEFERK